MELTALREVACVERGKNENAIRTLPHPMPIMPTNGGKHER